MKNSHPKKYVTSNLKQQFDLSIPDLKQHIKCYDDMLKIKPLDISFDPQIKFEDKHEEYKRGCYVMTFSFPQQVKAPEHPVMRDGQLCMPDGKLNPELAKDENNRLLKNRLR